MAFYEICTTTKMLKMNKARGCRLAVMLHQLSIATTWWFSLVAMQTSLVGYFGFLLLDDLDQLTLNGDSFACSFQHRFTDGCHTACNTIRTNCARIDGIQATVRGWWCDAFFSAWRWIPIFGTGRQKTTLATAACLNCGSAAAAIFTATNWWFRTILSRCKLAIWFLEKISFMK